MHIVLLCGGAGKRLWPLSNEIRSKLFIDALPSPSGGTESMIGRVCRQLDGAGLLASTLLVTHQDQANLTSRHTGNRVPVIGEPFKRGTFTAAARATAYLLSNKLVDLDEIICIAPADMYAGEDFFNLFKAFPRILNHTQADLVLLGTRPTHPSDQYGYIVPGHSNTDDYAPVSRFVEKPNTAEADDLIQQKALWNCGVYAFPLHFMLSYMESIGMPTNEEKFIAAYEEWPVRSFDKEVAEQADNAFVLPYAGEWHDLGSWDMLTAQLNRNVIGRGQVTGLSANTHIVNELPYPIHVIGVPDIIAAASPDGILISSKSRSNEIKDLLGHQQLRAMYGETSWGTYRVLDESESIKESTTLTVKITVLPNQHMNDRLHKSGLKIWTILSGSGEVMLGGKAYTARSGDVFRILENVVHSVRAATELEMIEVRLGDRLVQSLFGPDQNSTA